MKKIAYGSLFIICAVPAAAISPFVHGGLADIAPGN
jgi:hypothetical protein